MSGSTAPQLSPWQARQAAVLYWHSSLEYLQKFHTVLDQIINGLVDSEFVAPSRHDSSRILQHTQWGIQNAYKIVEPCPLSDFYCLERKVAEDITKRKKGIYAPTATDDELRKLQELWVCAYPPEKEHQYQQAIALINHFSYPIDSLFYGFPSPRWSDVSFAYLLPSFMMESPVIPKFRVRTDITGTTGQQPPCTGVYVAANDPHASLQFSVVNRSYFGLTNASTFSQVGLDALHAVGRDNLWFDDTRMHEFAASHKMWPQFRKRMEVSGKVHPDLARSAVSYHAFEERPATWNLVEIIPGEFEDIGMAHVDLSLPAPPGVRKAGERCHQTGYYSSVKQGIRFLPSELQPYASRGIVLLNIAERSTAGDGRGQRGSGEELFLSVVDVSRYPARRLGRVLVHSFSHPVILRDTEGARATFPAIPCGTKSWRSPSWPCMTTKATLPPASTP